MKYVVKQFTKKRIVSLLFFFLFQLCCFGQLTDLARVEYTFFPQKDSDNSFRRFRAMVNIPYPLNDDAYLITSLEYRNVNLLKRDPLPFNSSTTERFQNMVLSIGYTDKLESGWRYAFQIEGRLASNFVRSITADDFIFGGSAYMIKDRTGKNLENPPEKPWRLVLGINYSTTAGRPIPLPFVNYYREFAPKWSYALGVPKTNLKYQCASKMQLQGFVTLDGFFSNLQEDIPISGTNDIGETISMTTVLSGAGYEWEFVDHFVFFAYIGYTLVNDIRIRDGNNNDVFTINNTNSIYGRGGVKFKL